jgi:serine/threonine protein kinase
MQETTHKSKESINWNNWIEKSISEKSIKYFDYKNFNNIEEIGKGGFGKVYRANWKYTNQYFALKSFFNPDEVAIKELAHEVITKHDDLYEVF